mgnify:CR=1 FL=1
MSRRGAVYGQASANAGQKDKSAPVSSPYLQSLLQQVTNMEQEYDTTLLQTGENNIITDAFDSINKGIFDLI